MYRLILIVAAAAAAPQDNSITYIKMQPQTEEPLPAASYTSSVIENVPLTISDQDTSDYITDSRQSSDDSRQSTDDSRQSTDERIQNTDDRRQSTDERRQSTDDRRQSTDERRQSTDGLETESTEDSALEEYTETTEATTVTERYVPKISTTPKFKKALPKFYSKLSYFEKPKPNFSSVSTNLVERAGRRKFRSNCRCEKISNCPKLQITVPRCPDEYFLCCF